MKTVGWYWYPNKDSVVLNLQRLDVAFVSSMLCCPEVARRRQRVHPGIGFATWLSEMTKITPKASKLDKEERAGGSDGPEDRGVSPIEGNERSQSC